LFSYFLFDLTYLLIIILYFLITLSFKQIDKDVNKFY
jgi:hypothetical protein